MDISLPEDLEGLPYRKWGMTPESGLDCWGLISNASRLMGKHIPSYEQWIEGCEDALNKGVEAYGEQFEEVSSPMRGDIVLFALEAPNDHIAIMLDEKHFLHAREKGGVRRGRIDRMPYRLALRRILRWNGSRTP